MTRIQSFVIPGRLPGANEFIGAGYRNRYIGGSMKKKQTKLCAQYAMLIQPIKGPIALRVDWTERDNRRDIDNVAFGVKFILDGLREARKLPNDGRKWVQSITHNFLTPNKLAPQVEVVIEEELTTP